MIPRCIFLTNHHHTPLIRKSVGFCRRCSSFSMSKPPTFHGGRGGGSGRGRGGHGGGGVGGRGEQRWWDPAWRAERLGQKKVEMEVLNKNLWSAKLEQMKISAAQEIIIRSNYSLEDQQILSDMASHLGLYFHAYNKGKVLVISKVSLPNYRADLDDRHGSAQKEIQMSTEIERRVGNLLGNSKLAASENDFSGTSHSSNSAVPALSSSIKGSRQSFSGLNISDFFSNSESIAAKGKLNDELRQRQETLKASGSAKSMLAFREKLPAFRVKSEFLKAVAENQVVVVSGETGCGKTTQLPQFLLEEEISSLRGVDCRIVCTQPRRISAISVAARISSERGESLGETVGYQIRLESKRSAQTKLLFCTTGVLLRQLVQDPHFTGASHLVIDEIHERGMNEDFLLIILRDLLPMRPDLRIILMSATINAEFFSNYFGNAPTMHIPGFAFPVTELFLEDVLEKTHYIIKSEAESFNGSSRRRRKQQNSKKDPLTELFEDVDINTHYKEYGAHTRQSLEAWSGSVLDLELVEATIDHICRHEGKGAVLVFLTGWDDISKLHEKIKMNSFLGNPDRFLVLPLHGSMPTVNQREIFDHPPTNVRKIVLATNIAESSITIDDVIYVIDCGKSKETSYDALNKLACLLPSWISKASAHQRRGRAGRVQQGVCYRLYPKIVHDAMLEFQLPEILRTPLQELCLRIKSLRLGSIESFLGRALQPPDPLSISNAIELLKTIGALDDMEELTPLGRHLCTLPLDPNIGKMLLMGSVFQCLDPALTIASALAHRDPFVLPIDRKEEADAAKKYFAGDSCSDHIALMKAFNGWKAAKRTGNERAFCWQNFLSPVTLKTMEDMKTQFLDLLSDIGFVEKSWSFDAYNRYSSDLEMVSAVLCAGLYPNVVICKKRGKRTAFYTKEVGKVDLHPASVNSGVHYFPLPYLVYGEKVKSSSIYVRDSTNISDYALLMFGGNVTPTETGESIDMLGGYLHFSASTSVLELIRKLRAEVDKLLSRKIDEPGFDIAAEGQSVVAALVELLHNPIVQYSSHRTPDSKNFNSRRRNREYRDMNPRR